MNPLRTLFEGHLPQCPWRVLWVAPLVVTCLGAVPEASSVAWAQPLAAPSPGHAPGRGSDRLHPRNQKRAAHSYKRHRSGDSARSPAIVGDTASEHVGGWVGLGAGPRPSSNRGPRGDALSGGTGEPRGRSNLSVASHRIPTLIRQSDTRLMWNAQTGQNR